jgi:hypothetical protein
VGELATSQISNAFGSHCQSQEEDNESGSESEVVVQVESLLGCEEEKHQKVVC